ncbi:Fe(3+)-hydroxamate ABC transporter permease FhuB [Robbsia sp. KACC 23696]|uniref:Fe(3+)-hydroxamate ABC transporter permease FhuB n=1 Tax=Robbsia sp. KACC 23696 TaxID=3149231 RepID=UPI00325A7E02
MTTTEASRRPMRASMRPGYFTGALALFAACIFAVCLARYVPVMQWGALLTDTHSADLPLLIARYAFLPRAAASLLAGASLGLAGALLQHVLRNPLAEPTTLGVSAGATLSLTLVSLFCPALLSLGREGVAFVGAMLTLLFVAAISWHRGFSSIGIILSGLLVTLTAGAIGSVLTLFFGEDLMPVVLWQTGNLYQYGWTVSTHLTIGLVAGALLTALLTRPLAVLDLGDESARSLGQRPALIRALAMLIASALTAVVVSEVGLIGFIGLIAPWLAQRTGARALAQRLIWSALIGACLLWFADGCVQLLGRGGTELPVGVVTALGGAPLLIWMMGKLKEGAPTAAPSLPVSVKRQPTLSAGWRLIGGIVLLAGCAVLSAAFNRELAGWTWGTWQHVQMLLPLRMPRIVGAMSAGAMLSVAGVVMQRVTGNAMASPEVLGISSGALLALVFLMFVSPEASQGTQATAASVGALLVLLIMFSLSRRSRYSPDRLVITGVAITTVLGSLVALLIASGDPRVAQLQAWMSGSTYRIAAPAAMVASLCAVVVLVAVPFIALPLEIMSLGDASAQSVGVDLRKYRTVVLVLAAAATGAATLIVGPVSFVGLLGPHLARMMGFRRVLSQAIGAAMMGAVLMSIADWLGRNLLFPNQVPAGLLSMLIGGPFFLALMWKQKK